MAQLLLNGTEDAIAPPPGEVPDFSSQTVTHSAIFFSLTMVIALVFGRVFTKIHLKRKFFLIVSVSCRFLTLANLQKFLAMPDTYATHFHTTRRGDAVLVLLQLMFVSLCTLWLWSLGHGVGRAYWNVIVGETKQLAGV